MTRGIDELKHAVFLDIADVLKVALHRSAELLLHSPDPIRVHPGELFARLANLYRFRGVLVELF